MLTDILLLLGLILLNGLFAMAEIALITARRTRLTVMADSGSVPARAALNLTEQPTRLLSTVQIGLTSIGVLNGILGEAAFTGPVSGWLQQLGLEPTPSHAVATALVVVVITYLTIVIGELVPKRLGQLSPERIALFSAQPMLLLSRLVAVFVRLLSGSTELLLKLMGIRTEAPKQVTEEEINVVLEEGSESGAIEEQEHEMVRNVFRLDDRQIASLMTPRNEIEFLDIEDPLTDNLNRIAQSPHSRFPLVRGDLDDVLGIVSAKDLLGRFIRREGIDDLAKAASPAHFVPDSLTGLDLLQTFKASTSHSAIVLGEYGQTLGVVTVQDVLEAIAGEFKNHPSEEPWAIERDDGSWLMDGLIPVGDLKDKLQLACLPEQEKARYNTLAGMLMLMLARVPQSGDRVTWDQWDFEIVDMDGKRIDKVLVTRPAPAAASLGDQPA